MNPENQLTLSLLTACLMKQHEALGQMDALMRELMDRVESVGDLLWQMDRRHRLPAQHPQVDQVKTTRKRANQNHLLARNKLSSRKRRGMKV